MWLVVWAMQGITATIITFNESDRIAEAISSLSCCDEVIVVDSDSTDATRDVARVRGARVIQHPWEGYSKQKNFAAQQARNDWILSIDADERLSVELSASIADWRRAAPPPYKAWSMRRRPFYLGRWINHSGWYPDPKTRLYDRRYCQWEGDFVHEGLRVDGRIGELQGDLLHFPYRNFKDHAARIEKYTELAARAAESSGKRGSFLKLSVGPPAAFLNSFCLHAGFLDGWRGFIIAYMGARYVFRRQFRILR